MWSIVAYIILNVLGTTIFKLGSKNLEFGFNNYQLFFNVSITAIIGLTFYVLSFLMWIVMLKENDLSIAYPIALAVGIVSSVVIGFFLFKENVSLINWTGVVMMVIGLILVTFKK